VLPIAFVSEHSETLVELDIEYAELARDEGIETYVRVPAVGVHADFIAGLANVVQGASASDAEFCPQGDEERLCAASDRACPARMIR
ncbi:MAG: ferrochelatase, partial [Sphingomonadales bacterium]|nr:ferrochelatase [Sphingomonadales bacterium]